MLINCPAIMKHGEKTWEQKVATSVGDIVFGAINANGTIKTYIGIERKPNDPQNRFPLVVIATPERQEEIAGDGGRMEAPIKISIFENPRDRASAKTITIASETLSTTHDL